MLSHPPIAITELACHVTQLKASDGSRFSLEYESIEPGQQFTWEASTADMNKPKNRYANVIAYDHSRVILQPIDGIPGTDYINANYIDGYRRPNAYIATQVTSSCVTYCFYLFIRASVGWSFVSLTKLSTAYLLVCMYGFVFMLCKAVSNLSWIPVKS